MNRRVSMACLLGALFAGGCGEEEAETPGEKPTATANGTATATATATAMATVTATAEPERAPPPAGWGERRTWEGSFEEENELMFQELAYFHALHDGALDKVKAIISAGEVTGQGNPKVTVHPLSPAECEARVKEAGARYDDPEHERICGGKWMAPLYDPEHEQPSDAHACIDKLEFPDIPCRYPVTWVSAHDAVGLCQALGKRLCDAHEWEGACYGRVEPPDYEFDVAKHHQKVADARKAMRHRHNARVEKTKRWAYGPEYKEGICATHSAKSKSCGQGWRNCGTNTYPAGSFPACVSPLGVLDLHGNAAEHMNLPLAPEQMASDASQKYGQTEMKGSWFVFDIFRAHEDHCRWRAPDWHEGPVMSTGSHRNYHLGFRCCKSLGG